MSDRRAVALAACYAEHGTLPDSGGMLDQPAVWMDVLDVVLPIRGAVIEDRARKASEAARNG